MFKRYQFCTVDCRADEIGYLDGASHTLVNILHERCMAGFSTFLILSIFDSNIQRDHQIALTDGLINEQYDHTPKFNSLHLYGKGV